VQRSSRVSASRREQNSHNAAEPRLPRPESGLMHCLTAELNTASTQHMLYAYRSPRRLQLACVSASRGSAFASGRASSVSSSARRQGGRSVSSQQISWRQDDHHRLGGSSVTSPRTSSKGSRGTTSARLATCSVLPNPSLKLTRYGMQRKPGVRRLRHLRTPGLHCMPPRAA
jgi:hypothetical protein